MRRRTLLGLAGAALAGCRSSRNEAAVPLWYTYGGRNRKVLLELVERFEQEHPGTRLAPTFQGDYFEGLVKLRTGLFVGSVPAITHVVGEVIPYLARAGALLPLDLDDDVVADLVPQLAQSGTFSGGEGQPLFALPFNRSTPIAYYNKTLFDDLGLSPPSSWTEMRAVAEAATVRSGPTTSRWGFECPIDWWFWVALVGQAGGQVIEPDGTVSLGGDAGVEALRHWQAMVHEDKTMKPPPGRDYNAWEATNNDFLAGRVAMIWTSTAFLRYLEDNAQFEVATAALPAGVRRSVPTGGTFFVMPRGSDRRHREGALSFLRWMMQPAAANHWATSTGYMPVSRRGRAQLTAEGFYAAHPNDVVTLDQLYDAQPWPWAPHLFRVQREAVQPRLEAAVLLRRDARAALDEARHVATLR